GGVGQLGFGRRQAFVRPIHRRAFVHRFPRRVVVVRRFPHRVVVRRFPRRAFFVGAPIYAYGGGCAWLRHRALVTGSPYWWRRYRWCLGWEQRLGPVCAGSAAPGPPPFGGPKGLPIHLSRWKESLPKH